MEDSKYPLYYNVDDVPIIIELDGDEVIGKVGNGMPYPIGKAVVDGYKITKKEYDLLVEDKHYDFSLMLPLA